MLLGGLQRTTLVDFPGVVAATVFTLGCNFRCAYCHNPELVIPAQFAARLPEQKFFEFLESRRGRLDGVCITGGEPTLHADLPQFIDHIRELGFRVKLDTNGTNPERLEKLLQKGALDYVAMDIKNGPKRYAETANPRAGISSTLPESIQQSIALIIQSGADHEFRTTVAHPLHTTNDFYDIAELIRGGKRYFLQNYQRSKQVDPTIQFTPFTHQELERSAAIVRQTIPNVGLR